MTGVSVKGKQIILGASSHDHSVLSILIHEICHVVCDITFDDNHWLPYAKKDKASALEFDRIFEYFKQYYQDDMMQKLLKIFLLMFRENIQKDELIVRVPELITRDGLENARLILK